jgi:hypothetical protein
MDPQTNYENTKRSKERVFKEDFFLRLWKEISRKRDFLRNKCEEQKEDVRFYQGQAMLLRDIMGMPEKIMAELRKNLE